MFCKKCGKELVGDEKFCGYCSAPVKDRLVENNYLDNHSAHEKHSGNIIGLVINLLIGLCMVGYSFITYSNDTSKFWGYNYHSPLTGHEIMVITVGVGGVFLILVGIITYFVQVQKYK